MVEESPNIGTTAGDVRRPSSGLHDLTVKSSQVGRSISRKRLATLEREGSDGISDVKSTQLEFASLVEDGSDLVPHTVGPTS